MADPVPILICLVVPIFTFLLVALMKENRHDKSPIYWGFMIAVLTSIVIYIIIPILIK